MFLIYSFQKPWSEQVWPSCKGSTKKFIFKNKQPMFFIKSLDSWHKSVKIEGRLKSSCSSQNQPHRFVALKIISTSISVCPFVRVSFLQCVRKLPTIHAAVSQNVTCKSCLVCVKSRKYAFWVTLRPQSDCCRQGEAKVHILNFKTTWSEFQRPSQTASEQGNAELRILDFKTTWSEFQKPSQTATEQSEAKLRILNFKTTWSEFQKPSQTTTEQGEAELRILDFKTT